MPAHATQEVFDSVFHLNPSPMALADIASLRFVDVNNTFLTASGYTRDEVIGKTAADLHLAVDNERLESLIKEIQDGVHISNAELQFRCKNGALRHGLFSAKTIVCQGQAYLLAVILDITQHKKNEAQILFQAQVLDSVSEAVVVTDLNGTILYWGRGAENMYGYKADEVLGQPYRRFAGAIDPGDEDAFRRLILEKGFWHGENVQRRRDGSTFWSDVHISVLRDANGIASGFIGMDHDISARKGDEAEKLRLQTQLLQSQKMESIGRLAGGVAHDFNNLLMAIMGAAELCRESVPPDHPIQPDLNEITAAGQRATVLTRQLLTFARKQVISPKALNVNTAVSGMLSLLRRLIGEDIQLIWQPADKIWPVNIDPGQLDQILANLCINSRDAIPGVGRIVIATENVTVGQSDCGLRLDAQPGEYVAISVSDNGHGIDSDVLEHIFEPFFTTKPQGKGTGLGLATVYGVIRQNSGFIEVASIPGQGSTFRLHLPRFAGEVPEESVTFAEAPAEGGSETIMLVEDDPSVCATTHRFLEQLGYKVIATCYPADALLLADGYPNEIHLLLTDVIMPLMSGQELKRQFITRRPATRCLFISGYTADIITSQGILEDGFAILAKPFSRDELARKIRQILSN